MCLNDEIKWYRQGYFCSVWRGGVEGGVFGCQTFQILWRCCRLKSTNTHDAMYSLDNNNDILCTHKHLVLGQILTYNSFLTTAFVIHLILYHKPMKTDRTLAVKKIFWLIISILSFCLRERLNNTSSTLSFQDKSNLCTSEILMNNVGRRGSVQVHNPPCCKYNTRKEENDLMWSLAAILTFLVLLSAACKR